MTLTLADRLDIQDLAARYNTAIDSGDARAWAATFTSDGTFESGGHTHQGTDALAAFATGFAERMAGTRHWNNNLIIQGDGDQATLRCYLMLVRGPEVITSARYEDTLRRVDGEWRFASRRVVPDRPA
ncbi:MAG: nuclear transport factor 2 family protein [Dehalococcoidia bacterium]|nr:nuclear transport factor 2 family protein [Dehalococcoidia bacterium]